MIGGLALQSFHPPQVVNHLGQRLPFDVLHGIEVDRPLTSDRVDLHDVRMFERSGRAGLVLEPLKLPLVEHGGEGQDLERDLSPQRDLLRLVDHPHPAPADLAKDTVVAQRAHGRRAAGRQGVSGIGRFRGPARRAGQVPEDLQSQRHFAELLGVLRVLADVRLHVDFAAELDPLGHPLHQVEEHFPGIGR